MLHRLPTVPANNSSDVLGPAVDHTPIDDQFEYIMMCHNAIVGHNGIDRTLSRMFSLQHIWKNMKQHVRTFIRQSTVDPKIHATHFETSNYTIFETLNTDFIGTF